MQKINTRRKLLSNLDLHRHLAQSVQPHLCIFEGEHLTQWWGLNQANGE